VMRLSPKYGLIVEKEFFQRSSDIVARELLGKLLLRYINDIVIGGIIVETEAYFGAEDPASRASKGGKIGELMYREPGYILVYMVHANWLLNIVTGYLGQPSAVLIRALEPMIGIELMRRNRGVYDMRILTSGPGRLTKALKIDDSFNKFNVCDDDSPIKILYFYEYDENEVGRSMRIGVTEDLDKPYRFFIRDNEYVSRK